MSRMFGTDGVRGVANEELTPLLAMQLGQAGAYVLTRENKHKPTIMVGCDTRMSGDMLANALMAGICSVGANAVYVGVIPTPAIAYLTKKYKVEAGVVISASHNPMEFNGIKFFDGNGYKLPDALEDEIEALIKNNMNRVEFPTGSSVGRIKYRKDAREEYINHAVRAVPVDLTNLKVVVDCAEGASHYTSIEALRQLGAQVVPIHNMPDGTNINANCGSTHMEELQARVVYEKANIGLAFDGDADRLLAVDELGNVVDGDQIMAIVGAHMRNMGKLKQNTIVATAGNHGRLRNRAVWRSDDAFQKLSLGNRGNCPDVSGSDVRLCVPFSKIPCRPGDDCFFLCILPGDAVSIYLSDPGTELGKISGVAHFYQLLDL